MRRCQSNNSKYTFLVIHLLVIDQLATLGASFVHNSYHQYHHKQKSAINLLPTVPIAVGRHANLQDKRDKRDKRVRCGRQYLGNGRPFAPPPSFAQSSTFLQMINNEQCENENSINGGGKIKSANNKTNENNNYAPSAPQKAGFSPSNILELANTSIEASMATQNRRLFFSSVLMSSGIALLPPIDQQQQQQQQHSIPPDFVSKYFTASADEITWSPSPINKRSGITVYKAEETYNIKFITYLSRFLLSFDEECQKWWYKRAGDIPKSSSLEQVNNMRLKQFGSFSASVEVGLQEYEGEGGPKTLMSSLLDRYGKDIEEIKSIREQKGLPPYKAYEEERIKGEIKEAKRQIALLFGLLKTYQPVEEITKLLAAIDNARIQRVEIIKNGGGYAPGYGAPAVTFVKPAAGEGYEAATGRVRLRPNGQILRIDLKQRGFGYNKPPTVEISPPMAEAFGSPFAEAATAKAYIFRDGMNKGRIERIELLSPGSGYKEDEPVKVTFSPTDVSADEGGQSCVAQAVMEYEVGEIEIVNPGNGYASEKPFLIQVDPPPLTARVNLNDPMVVKQLSPDATSQQLLGKASKNTDIFDPSSMKTKAWKMAKIGGGGGCVGRACYDDPVVAYAYPVAEADSYSSFRSNGGSGGINMDTGSREKINAANGGDDTYMPQLPFWSGSSSSKSSLLSLLPTGIGLSYNTDLSRYELVANEEAISNFEMVSVTPGKPIDTGKKVLILCIDIDVHYHLVLTKFLCLIIISCFLFFLLPMVDFGPRGRSPIEREKTLTSDIVLRFFAAGALCQSSVHLVLTPLDVVKTNIQTDPKKYTNPFTTFGLLLEESGISGFFAGWVPTFVGFFINGGFSYALTEFFRR